MVKKLCICKQIHVINHEIVFFFCFTLFNNMLQFFCSLNYVVILVPLMCIIHMILCVSHYGGQTISECCLKRHKSVWLAHFSMVES